MTKKFDFSVLSIKQQHETMTRLLKYEQEVLWEEFLREINRAQNGYWSMGCENVAERIIANAMIVGPAPWKSVPWPVVGGGLWANMWYAAQLVNTPQTIPTKDLEEVEDQVSDKGLYEEKTLEFLFKRYHESRVKMIEYVDKRRKAGDFNIDQEPEPECTCAMTEASFFACMVHGENAAEDASDKWKVSKAKKVKHCTCKGSKSIQVVAACPIHGLKKSDPVEWKALEEWSPF